MGGLCFKETEDDLPSEHVYDVNGRHVGRRRGNVSAVQMKGGGRKGHKGAVMQHSGRMVYRPKEMESLKMKTLEIFASPSCSSSLGDSTNPQDGSKTPSEESTHPHPPSNESLFTRLDREVAEQALKSFARIQQLAPVTDFVRLYAQSAAREVFGSILVLECR